MSRLVPRSGWFMISAVGAATITAATKKSGHCNWPSRL